MQHLNLFEVEKAALERLEPSARDYYRSGADDEITLSQNQSAFRRLHLRYRVLRDVSTRRAETSVLGDDVSLPVLVAPTAFHGLACEEAELATVRAAGRAGTVFTLSTLSNTPMEAVTEAATGPVWFQLYVYRDRDVTLALVQRAEAAGCRALVLTVDAPLIGRRERDVRNRFQLPGGLGVANLLPHGHDALPAGDSSGLAAYVADVLDPSLSWTDVGWLASKTALPILVKGIVHPEDARLALEHGVAGIVVSNHGGRQLDTSLPTISALPDVVRVVDDRIPILLDGGVRRGTDVIKAVALGARAVLLGRPVLWGLAVDGEEGALQVLEMMRAELDLAMALCGAATLSDLGADLVVEAGY